MDMDEIERACVAIRNERGITVGEVVEGKPAVGQCVRIEFQDENGVHRFDRGTVKEVF
jgi:hypothetical protein